MRTVPLLIAAVILIAALAPTAPLARRHARACRALLDSARTAADSARVRATTRGYRRATCGQYLDTATPADS